MQEHAVPVGHLVLPVLLPLAEGKLLEELVSGDDEHRCSGLEAYPALDAYDGVTHMHIPAYAICGSDFLDSLDCGHLVIIFDSVHAAELALAETEAEHFAAGLGHLLEVCALRQTLGGVENLSSADGSSPYSHIVGVLQLGEIGVEAVGVEIVHLLLAAEVAVAGEGDDLHLRTEHEEGHVETDLVVARSGGAMGDGVSPYLLGISCYGHALEYAL